MLNGFFQLSLPLCFLFCSVQICALILREGTAHLELGNNCRHYVLGKQFVQCFLRVMRSTLEAFTDVFPVIQGDTYLHTRTVIKPARTIGQENHAPSPTRQSRLVGATRARSLHQAQVFQEVVAPRPQSRQQKSHA